MILGSATANGGDIMVSAPSLSVEKDVEMNLNRGVWESWQEVEFSRTQRQQQRESSPAS